MKTDEKVSDSELAKRTLDGDLEAFTVLVYRYKDVAYASAYSILWNFEDARDIAQEAWIKIYQSLIKFNQNDSFSAWLYKISKRCAIDYLRKRKDLTTVDLSIAANIPDQRMRPDEEQEDKETYEIVHRALTSLSEVNRETAILFYINGFSQVDISEILNIPLGTVKRRLYDSRKLLQKEVIKMVGNVFEKNKLEWKFTQDVVNQVSELKKNIVDYLPERFQELARMSDEELGDRQKHLLKSLIEVLDVPVGKVDGDDKITIKPADISGDQKSYLWQTLHEMELIDIISTIKSGSSFEVFIKEFDNIEVVVGKYSKGGLYLAFRRPWSDDSQAWYQTGVE
jgi:RNA polymerase sigma-70 factor, ECF subfamily